MESANIPVSVVRKKERKHSKTNFSQKEKINFKIKNSNDEYHSPEKSEQEYQKNDISLLLSHKYTQCMYRLTLSSFLALCLVPTILIPQMRFVPSSPSMPNTNLNRIFREKKYMN